MLYKARIGEDGLALFEYSSSEADGFITMIRIVDSTGERTITPSLDAYPFKDFVFERGVVSLKTPGRILESDFGIFGTIISDETVSTQGGEAFGSGDFLTRKMAFEKISLTLVQYSRDLHTDRWSIWEMSIKDPGFANTRGIAVGLSLTETLQKISNGEFGYSMNLDNGKIRSIDIKKFSEEYVYMTLEFEEDKIAEIRIEFAAP
jgi:hypothetical protein